MSINTLVNRRNLIKSVGLSAAGMALMSQSNASSVAIETNERNGDVVNGIPLQGVIPAALTPFDVDLKVSLREYRKHIQKLSSISGVTAILVNGGAGELASLSRGERRSLVAEAVAAAGDVPVIASLEEIDDEGLDVFAKDAEIEGARAVMVMPPKNEADSQWKNAQARYNQVFNATDLPVVIFHTTYSNETLLKLTAFPQVFAVKEASARPFDFERNLRSIRSLRKDVAVWSTHTSWFLSDLALGADGILSGMGSFAASLHVDLFEAIQRSDLNAAKKVADSLYPLQDAIRYSCVEHDNFAYAVMKYALVELGQWDDAYVRAPYLPFTDKSLQEKFKQAIKESGLT